MTTREAVIVATGALDELLGEDVAAEWAATGALPEVEPDEDEDEVEIGDALVGGGFGQMVEIG